MINIDKRQTTNDTMADRTRNNIELLIVDDEPESINEMSEYLEKKGFACHKASDGGDAIAVFENNNNIGVVVTDIRMPGMDGLQLIHKIRDALPAERQVKTIIVTGNPGKKEAVSALHNGASDFITKPVSLKHLVHSIKRCVEEIEAQDDKKRDNERLKKALQQERRLNKLQREFVCMVSHEFRTPLAIIDSAAQRIAKMDFSFKRNDLNKRIDRIRSSVRRMVGLIESVLSASGSDTGEIIFTSSPCDLRQIILNVCVEQKELSANHIINTDLEQIPRTFMGDQGLLRQVFTNILSNAVKYSPHGKFIEVSGRIDGDVVAVAVRDYGIGIPEDDMPNLFNKFTRASTSTGIPGTGIGLYTAKKFIEMHGGTISVTSKTDEGTTFIACLPVSPQAKDDKI